MTRPAEPTRQIVPRRGLSREEAALYVGISASKFDMLVDDGRMPRPRQIDRRKVSEIAAYEARWPVGTRERLALALLLYTGQRRSDVIRMGWPTYQGGAIAVVQQKTGASLVIPAHPELRAVLDNTPRDNLAFLVTAFGKPFTPAGFTNWFRDKCRDAGLPARCKPHGLRKASARKLAEAGATPHEIKAVTGHESLREVENYTRAVDQQRLAARAIGRLPG